ncbi:MAG: transporter permease [Anaerocolumna sp.]|jgi:putative ABC transport system permease protein|nr:transporter permease [Anaerocolumna sp.]
MGVLILGKRFFVRLAATNIKRDKKMYVPFIIAFSAIVSIYFMVVTIMYSKGLADVPSGDTLQSLFQVGFVIMSLMTVIFMLYINSFLIKRRKREFGLYGILGLEKRHVGRVIMWENSIISGISILLGILSGCIFGKLIFLLIFYTLRVSSNSKFDLPIEAFIYTFILFFGIFVLTTMFNLLQVRLANPIDLLKGERIGEKKVRFVMIKTLLGISLLIWAYYSALTVSNALGALNTFLLAVIAVILATQFLFEAGSLFFLNLLKNNKKIFYKANNFIAIAGLSHRMKQNAAGLASICILSTMVLITVSTTTALYLGQEDMIKLMNPNDIQIESHTDLTDENMDQLNNLIQKTSKESNIEIEDQYTYHQYKDIYLYRNHEFSSVSDDIYKDMTKYREMEKYLWEASFITIDEYNEITQKSETLSDNEIVLLVNDELKDLFGNKTVNQLAEFKVKSIEFDSKLTHGKNGELNKQLFIIVQKQDDILKFIQSMNSKFREENANIITILNVKGENSNLLTFSKVMKAVDIDSVYRVNSIFYDREDGYGIYGGLLFLGIFFTILFLTATVLIIYFKQISEGYDDKERFVILQKVGMDDREVRKTINKQILIVFFLPLIGALLHVTVARHIILKLLEVFYLYNIVLTTVCIIATCIVFILAYIFVFRLTAKTYYKIVKW